MDVDKLFNLPNIGSQKNKRKWAGDAPPPGQLRPLRPKKQRPDVSFSALKEALAKASRPRVDESVSSDAMPPPPLPSSKGKQRATVEDMSEDGDEADVADFAPGNDADYFAEEDGEGRFFGGGLTTEQKKILEIMDTDDAETQADQLTVQGARKMLLTLEKAIGKNRELRVKYANDPTKFVDSEVALDGALHSLLLFTQNAGAFYPEIVRLGVVASMADLLSRMLLKKKP
jgi:beta-catenin-like protein 1